MKKLYMVLGMRVSTYVFQGRLIYWGKKYQQAVIYVPIEAAREMEEHKGKLVTVVVHVPEREVKPRWKRKSKKERP